jgi:hypothetical protein
MEFENLSGEEVRSKSNQNTQHNQKSDRNPSDSLHLELLTKNAKPKAPKHQSDPVKKSQFQPEAIGPVKINLKSIRTFQEIQGIPESLDGEYLEHSEYSKLYSEISDQEINHGSLGKTDLASYGVDRNLRRSSLLNIQQVKAEANHGFEKVKISSNKRYFSSEIRGLLLPTKKTKIANKSRKKVWNKFQQIKNGLGKEDVDSEGSKTNILVAQILNSVVTLNHGNPKPKSVEKATEKPENDNDQTAMPEKVFFEGKLVKKKQFVRSGRLHEIIYLVDEKYAAEVEAIRKQKDHNEVTLAPPMGSMNSLKL